jgi:hypothetical protein
MDIVITYGYAEGRGFLATATTNITDDVSLKESS